MPYQKRNWTGTGSRIREMQRVLAEKKEQAELEEAIRLSLQPQDPEGWPFPGYDPSQPFAFRRCPSNIQERILFYAVYAYYPPRMVAPRYNVGSVQDTYLATKDLTNIDIGLFLRLGDMAFYQAAMSAFYGSNIYIFSDPTLALWWLKRIGSLLQKVKELRFHFHEGEVTGSLNVRTERIWFLLFDWLKSRHQLQRIVINVKEWDTRTFGEGSQPLRDPRIFETRHSILRKFLTFRGLSTAKIVGGRWVNAFEVGVLEKAMTLGEGETREDVERYDGRLEEQLGWELKEPLVQKKARYLIK